MMKNFTKILLGLIASATTLSVNAMEWRIVSNEDFGGNSASDPVICTAAPHDDDADKEEGFYTPLNFSGIINPTPGNYMVIKSTELAKSQWGDKLTDCGNQGACWENFGDHTNPSNQELGYFMVFDAIDNGPAVDINNSLILYKKSLKVSCSNVQFRFSSYMASASKWGGNTVRLSIQDENGNNLAELNDDLAASTITPGNWKKMETMFQVKEKNISKVYFVVMATSVSSSGYDLALDDITIEVNQPTLEISASDFFYQKPATLSVEYKQSEFDNFFDDSYSNVVYKWYKRNESTLEFEEISSAGGKYESGKDISYTIPSFEKDKHNGTYRLIVSTDDNVGNNLCSIQKDFVINEDKDKIEVIMCKDSTKVMPDGTVLTTETNDVQWIEAPSVDYFVICIPYVILDPKYDMQCLNSDYPTVGDIKLDDIIERDQESGCPTSIQKHYIRVTDNVVMDDPKHMCEGDEYITNDNVKKIYTEVNEIEGDSIAFDSDGCRHAQYVFVHPKYEVEEDVPVCKGDSYDGVPYNKVGTYKGSEIKLQSIWGCDSIITPNITVVEPVEITKSAIVCPSDNYEFAGKVYNYPIDTVIVEKIENGASNGCDSTTTLHLVVNEGGEVHLDTLICREQILFGDSFMVAGSFQKKITGFTESGCPIDTIWNIEVVQISLRLRMFGDQDEVCKGQPSTMVVKLNAYDSKNNGKTYTPTHYWEPEVPQNVISPTLYLNETTTYTIYADLDLPSDVDKNAKGCHAKESKTITVHPIPELSVDSVNPDDRSVEYTVTGGTMPYHMFLGSKDLGILEGNTDKKDRLPYGTHILQVQDSTGCSAEQEIVVKAVQPEPSIFFTPNGDGENDRWKIKNLDTYPTSTIRIYDRYGKLLYTSTAQYFEDGWDGTYNGTKLPATDYWYEIDIDEIDQQYFGHFTLIR